MAGKDYSRLNQGEIMKDSKTIIESLEKAPQSELSEDAKRLNERQSRSISTALTAKLWAKFTDLYGYTFIRQYGEEPSDTWISCLYGITPDQMAEGLKKCLELHPEWPPGAAQFRCLCLGEKASESWEHRTDAYKRFDKTKALAVKSLSKAEQKEAVSKILRDLE